MTPPPVRYVHVPVAVFLANRDAILANPHPLGLLVSPGDKVEDVENDLGRFASVAINFPAFTDGRGYSSARMINERYKYKGELRAVGDVLARPDPADAPLWHRGFRGQARADQEGAGGRLAGRASTSTTSPSEPPKSRSGRGPSCVARADRATSSPPPRPSTRSG